MTIEKRGDGTVGKALDVLSEVVRSALPLDFLAYLKLANIQKQPFTDFSKRFLTRTCSATTKKSRPIN